MIDMAMRREATEQSDRLRWIRGGKAFEEEFPIAMNDERRRTEGLVQLDDQRILARSRPFE